MSKIVDNTQMITDRPEDECLGDIIAEDEDERDPRVWDRLERGCWRRERLPGVE